MDGWMMELHRFVERGISALAKKVESDEEALRIRGQEIARIPVQFIRKHKLTS